jgi:cytochrome c553
MRNVIFSAMFASAALCTGAQAGDPAAGKAKAIVCAGCHGADGNSVNASWPKLAGQHETYLVKALNAYRTGARSDAVMNAMSKPLTDADVQNLASWFASQKQK